MHKRKKKIEFIITTALIAAAYAGLTYLCAIWNLAYGPIQLRISEVLTVLPLFTPAAIPGLTIGCFFANIGSFNIADMLFGTLATLAAAILTYYLRKITIKGLPIFAFFPPVIVNALIIGFEISLFYLEAKNFLWGFLISALEVGAGEFIVCFALGIPFYLVVKKYRIFGTNRFKEK